MSTISRHLAQLKQVGLLRDCREGSKILYELRTPCVLRFIDCIGNVIRTTRRRGRGGERTLAASWMSLGVG